MDRMAAPGTDRGQPPHLLRFGTFELDLSTQELRKAGALVKLQSQQFQLLVLLAERGGQVVTREEIRKTLWGNQTFVDFDRGINFCVNQIRGALDDDPQDPRYIKTLPRKGYCFIAPVAGLESSKATIGTVTEDDTGPVEASKTAVAPRPIWRQRRLLLSGALMGAVLVAVLSVYGLRSRLLPSKPIQSLAVLPLENLSHDPEQDYFADGMTDEVITALAKIGALRVVSRTSVIRYRGSKKPLPEIARELKVDAVMEGTVLRAQNRVRITAQLVRASPEEHLWAERYEGSLENVLTLQNNVAQDVARSIKINLTPRERTVLATPRAVDPAAYEDYSKGRYLRNSPTEENLTKSREYFEQAIARDPHYALAWAGLAETTNYLANWGVLPSQDARPRARAAAERALQLDNSLVEPLVTLAGVKFNFEWDWAGAEGLCNQAIALDPNYGEAHHVYATYLAEVGRVREAVAEERRALEVEPLSPEYGANVVWKLYLARQYDEAQLEFRNLSRWDPYLGANLTTASVYMRIGRQREAIAVLQKDAEESHRSVLQLMYLGHDLGVTGARAEGQKVLEEMLSRRRYVPPEYIAIVYEGLGERERALQWFEKGFTEHSMNGWILPDPRLDQIRTEPRFKEILRRMGLPH
jgi:TolB-like protein/DNA-binding winged helix-turn-helix (wHTH) protein/Tfp pilus assembly protein PilF